MQPPIARGVPRLERAEPAATAEGTELALGKSSRAARSACCGGKAQEQGSIPRRHGVLRWKQSSATVPLRIQPAAACKNRPARGLSKAVVDSLCCTAHMNGEATRMARVARAVLEPGSKRIPLGRIRVPNRGHQNDPGMTRRRLEGVCGLEIGRPAVHAVHLLRLGRKMHIHRMECQDTAAEARGNAYTRSLESACDSRF